MSPHLLRTVSVPVLIALSACAPGSNPGDVADAISADVVVCADRGGSTEGCDYNGIEGLQDAVDAAASKSVIRIAEGEYLPSSYRDVPFQDLVVRGAIVVDEKDVTFLADEGAVLQGSEAFPVSAMVVRNSKVEITGLEISDFFYGEPEDDVYDGHGIFTINSQVTLKDVSITGIDKMAVTGRENGEISATGLSVRDSHLGVWLEEFAQFKMVDSEIVGSESAGIAAYGDAAAIAENSVIGTNEDDGLYTENRARITSVDSMIRGNSPFGARAADESTILICGGSMLDNEADMGTEGAGRVLLDDEEACAL